MALERIDKILASTGKWSRSEAKDLIRFHRVLVNGQAVHRGEEKFDPETAHIAVRGEEICYRAFTWVMMNKPAGLLSARSDRRAATVLELLSPELKRLELFPVGRLDKDSEGLLLLTNDGAAAHRLLSPKHHVEKEYYVETEGRLTEADAARFSAGMILADGLKCREAGLQILSVGEKSRALVTVHEGKFHQVKRMLADCGKPVTYLKRIRMGNLTLDETLKSGEYRLLSEKELSLLPHE